MENQENKNSYYGLANTVRISPSELEFIQENYEAIADTSEKIGFSKFFMSAVTKAVSSVRPKTMEIFKDTPETSALLSALQDENARLKNELENKPQPKGLVIDLNPDWRRYFWGILEVSKKEGFAQSYEDLLVKMLKIFHQRKELMLNPEDLKYLDTLEYEE